MTTIQTAKIQCIIDSMQSEQRQQFYVKFNNEKVSVFKMAMVLTFLYPFAPFFKKIKLNSVVKGILIAIFFVVIIDLFLKLIVIIFVNFFGFPGILLFLSAMLNLIRKCLIILYLIFVLLNAKKDYETTNNIIKEGILREMGYGL